MALSARNGSFAEYVTMPGAAVIGLVGVAAHDALEALNIQPGDVVHKVLHAAALGTTLQAGGRIASTRGVSSGEIGRADVTLVPITAAASAAELAAPLDQVAAGTLRVNIEAVIPLERAPEAFAAFADGTLGTVPIAR